MASIVKYADGRKRVQYSLDGHSRTVRLGRVDMRFAEGVRVKVDALLAARRTGLPPDADTAAWLGAVGDDLHATLAGAGLAVPRAASPRTCAGACW